MSFLLDPEYIENERKVFAVKASAKPPDKWQDSPEDYTLYFGRGWRQQIGELVGFLSGLRGKGAA